MEKHAPKVLYETRHHASGPYVPSYPPLPQAVGNGATGGIRSLISVRGVSQLKEKWSDYWHPRKNHKPVSLFISPRGELAAVGAGNHVIILKKEDDYKNPCGTFTSSITGSFTSGVWSETHDVLGLVDDCGTLFFIKANGEEITRVMKKHLKISSSLVGLVEDEYGPQGSCLCSFTVLASDGLLHHVEISREPSASASSRHTSRSVTALYRQFPHQVFCFDYHPELSFFLIVSSEGGISSTGSSGSSCISLWRKCQTDLELLFTTKFEGAYGKSKDDQLAFPKVLFSPQGSHVATLDINGRVHVFQLDKEGHSLSYFLSEDSSGSLNKDELIQNWKESLSDIVDFTWWSDHVLTIVKRRGNVSIFDIHRCLTVQDDAAVYSMPIVERVRRSEGHIFLLESSLSEARSDAAKADRNSSRLALSSNRGMSWRLLSLTEKTIPEMYRILIQDSRYQEALDFADNHGLDRDEVFKSKWLKSDIGINEINMILSYIKDKTFVISECLERIGHTEDSTKALLAHGLQRTNCSVFSESDDEESKELWDLRLARLRLLQFDERLETYLGINMGRFSVQEYSKFRSMHINEAAAALAKSGKIGALNLLFKRHPYSLSSFMLQVLNAIPETVPVQTYAHLLPGKYPPKSMAVREEDWVECDKMINYIDKLPNNGEISSHIRTEPMVRRCSGYYWPSMEELIQWYKNRARSIDASTGLLDNCLCLIDIACRKDISDLDQFHEDLSYLHQIIYSDENDSGVCVSLSLVAWEQLSDYEKFKIMLEGAKEDTLVKKLHEKAIPFLQKRISNHNEESLLVKWLKDMAMKNSLELCSQVIEEGCMDLYSTHFFKDEVEAVDCALQCLYLCRLTNKWSAMSAILSKLPQIHEICGGELEKRLQLAEAHIESGRLLEFYQVPKPMKFFIDVHLDEKGVKQILRLMLSKFVRRQPGRSDNDWACMWRDLQYLRENAFPFLELDFMLVEFCRGLLKAGKFSLARNYLKGSGSVALPSEKAESLVINAAREYFFSATSLASEEIWRARECLNIFYSSPTVKAEADFIDAVTVKLPDLGVALLPMQFKQIKDPMEIIKLAITGQPGAYLHVEDLIEAAKLLGLNSSEEISSVEEAIAREAAVAGDMQLAFDLCLALTKKGHGPIWDLCAAIARGPALENMDICSRKQLLGFALGHCDDESISELLHAWKDLDLQGHCEALGVLSESDLPDFHDSRDYPKMVNELGQDQELDLGKTKDTLSSVAKDMAVENGMDWETVLEENGKLLSFATSHLPWLLNLSRNKRFDKNLVSGSIPGKQFISVKATSLVTILSWLAGNGFAPRDELIAMITESIVEQPVTKEEDIMGCSFLLNLVDASQAVEVIEKQLRIRENYQEIQSIMSLGMTYSLLHDFGVECTDPAERRELIWNSFKRKQANSHSDEINRIGKVQSTFWKEWKQKLEEKMDVADRSRLLERVIPDVEVERFLSNDINYIKATIFSLIDSLKSEKKMMLKDILKLADTYGLKQSEVILRYLSCVLCSEIWANEDIATEISCIKEETLASASDTVRIICTVVYPTINGLNKDRLAYIYGLLSDCCWHLEKSEKLPSLEVQLHGSSIGLATMYKILEQECRRVSFITDLDFKNIVGPNGLNFDSFNNEIRAHINEINLEALAKMVETLVSVFTKNVPRGLMSWQDVYIQYIMNLLDMVESRRSLCFQSAESFQGLVNQLEQTYDHCRTYIGLLEPLQGLEILKQHLTIVSQPNDSYVNVPDSSAWQECLILLINFWIRLADEMQEIKSSGKIPLERLSFSPECIKSCLMVLMRLVMDDSLSPSQALAAILVYLRCGLLGDSATETFNFYRAVVFSGCGFAPISEVFSELSFQYPTALSDLPHLYLNILEPILQDSVSGRHRTENLYRLLSSLSNLEGDLEELKRVRLIVWDKLVQFSENLEFPSQVRVYSLELMQFIADKNIKGTSSELQSKVLPWDGSDELLLSMQKTQTTPAEPKLDRADGSNRLTNTLVALKSSQIVGSSISPDIEISPEDLSSIETSVSCFLKLSGSVGTVSQIDTLLAILKEWEELFDDKKLEAQPASETSDVGNSNWGDDDWNDGWETLQDSETIGEEKETHGLSISVHALHSCWLEIFRKYVALSMPEKVLQLIDRSLQKPNSVLLQEDEVEILATILTDTDPFLALKLSLLFPYERIRSQCLCVVEDKLKQSGIPDSSCHSFNEVLLLIIYSGTLSTVITKSSYGCVFSFLCYVVGNITRAFLEAKMSSLNSTKQEETKEENIYGKRFLSCFGEFIFPCFVSELVKADQQILAGFLVGRFMHINPSLSLINVTEPSLRRYLERRLESAEEGMEGNGEDNYMETLKNTMLGVRERSKDVIQTALAYLSSCTSSR